MSAEIDTHTEEKQKPSTQRLPWWKRLWGRTGFSNKTVWDFLQLLIVPLMLAVIGFWFTAQQDARQLETETRRAKAERELAEQRAQDEALQAYLDQMSTLILDRNLLESKQANPTYTLAQARTATVMTRLDAARNRSVVRFLSDSGLAGTLLRGIALDGADLSGADLSGADLSGASLSKADLSGAFLDRADLSDANLAKADLSGASLADADLSDAWLDDADLSGASPLSVTYLGGANLSGAYLENADLSGAIMSYADLSGAYLNKADLSGAELRGADLSDANLHKVNLSDAYMNKANLDGAVGWTEEQLSEARSLKRATIPTGQKILPNGQKTPLSALPALPLKSGRARLEPRREYVVTDKYAFEPAFRFKLGSSKYWHSWSPPKLAEEVSLDKTGPEGGFLTFFRPRYVFDPSNPSERKEVPAPQDVDEWASWFQSHPYLETSKPVPVKVGGAPGLQIDITAHSPPKNYPKDWCGETPCVPLFPSGESQEVHSVHPLLGIVAFEERAKRFVIVDVEGETVVIVVGAGAGNYNEFLPNAQNVLDSVKWETEQAPSTAEDGENGSP